MGKGFKEGGSGGASLNFKVVGNPQPTSPKENTIWVNTDRKITSWIFSAEEPAESVEGMVWITTGTSSAVEFNALKKNAIQVYPISAKQYVSGAFVDVTAQSYHGGEWVEWFDGEIYNVGTQYIPLQKYSLADGGTVTFNAGNINMSAPKNTATGVETVDLIDLTSAKTVSVTYDSKTSGGEISIKIEDSSRNTVVRANSNSSTSGTLTCDVSSIFGDHRIVVQIYKGTEPISCNVTNIKVII